MDCRRIKQRAPKFPQIDMATNNQIDIYPSSSLSAGDERAPERGGPGAPVQPADALAREDVLEAARQVALLLHVLARVRRL